MRERRSAAVVALALLAVLLSAGVVATDRLRDPGDRHAVEAIDPSFEVARERTPAPTPPAPPAKPKPKPVTRRAAARTSCPALPSVPAASATAARAVVSRAKVYDRPGGRVVRTLTNPTIEGQQLHGLVRGRQDGWLRIQLVARPNGSTGWVKDADFATYDTPYRIVVQRCTKRLTVFQSGRAVWSRSVAVGKPSTPTPTGDFFVDFVTPMPCCAYGPMMLSVAGFSDVLFQFGKDGTGQIAIHGTSAAWSVGKAASNGCVRMYNADVLALSKLVPAGTPVTIRD